MLKVLCVHIFLNICRTLNSSIDLTAADIVSKYSQQSTSVTDLTTRQGKMDVEVKSLMHIIHETEDKCDKFEKVLNEYKFRVSETQQKLDDLEVHLKYQNRLMGITNTRGHLIWRIDKYSTRLKEAKENDIMLRSPLFCNRHYGYTLRVSYYYNNYFIFHL